MLFPLEVTKITAPLAVFTTDKMDLIHWQSDILKLCGDKQTVWELWNQLKEGRCSVSGPNSDTLLLFLKEHGNIILHKGETIHLKGECFGTYDFLFSHQTFVLDLWLSQSGPLPLLIVEEWFNK